MQQPVTQSKGYLSPVYRSIPAAVPPINPLVLHSQFLNKPNMDNNNNNNTMSSFLAKLDKLKVQYTLTNAFAADCRYQAEDGNERCAFTVSNLASSSRPITCERTEGCCFLFKRIASQLLDTQQQQPARMFRCLPLPRELASNDDDSVDAGFARVQQACSQSLEQQEQLCNTASAMLMRGEHVDQCTRVLQACSQGMLNPCVQRRLVCRD